MRQAVARASVVAVLFLVQLLRCAQIVPAQQLPIRSYGVSDGLAHSIVHSIHQDAKGYLWFATNEGVSRFDGYRFTNYGTRDGIGHLTVNVITEDKAGRIWIGTNGAGVSRFIDEPREAPSIQNSNRMARQKFVNFPVGDSPQSNRVNAMLFDPQGNLWCATDAGLYRAAASANDDFRFEVVVAHKPVTEPMAAFADSQGRLWFGIINDLTEVVSDHFNTYNAADEVGRSQILSIAEDRGGRLLVANTRGVFEFIATADPTSRGRWKKLPVVLTPDQMISSMAADSTGSIWLGTTKGLIKYKDNRQMAYTTAQGLSDDNILALNEDRDGNLWIGTNGGGVCKLFGEMLVSFTKTEGFTDQNVSKITQDREGRMYATAGLRGPFEIVEARAVPVQSSQAQPFVLSSFLQDSRGDWWVGTDRGLFLFGGPHLQLRRGKKLTLADGFPETAIASIYEDPNGTVWIGSDDGYLYRCDSSPDKRAVVKRVPLGPDWPSNKKPRLFMSDRAGTLWLGDQGIIGKLVRGRIVVLQPTEGLPETDPRAFFQDSRGWLWIGLRYKGVSMTKDPAAENPRFLNYSTESGLASDAIRSVAEDDFGRIYFGTGRGLDRLDLSTGRIRHFTTADGLAGDQINHCAKDGQGNIWAATTMGLSKLNPRAERTENRPPPIYVSRVQVAGEDLPLAETGATLMQIPELASSRNNLLIEYVGLDFRGERALRYQYRLEGADSDWSLQTEQRSVNYARLAPGSYRFLVRAINQEGIESLEPAVLEFRILPPIWQRWWFLILSAVFLGLVIYATYRYRVARLIELERVRTRIASDLHDDIGSNLSLIAGLSEVLRQETRKVDSQIADRLSIISSVSRRSVDAMSDIVWAINPNKDYLRDLTQRMRRFASDAFASRNMEFRFNAPSTEQDIKISSDVRREVFLIFKEGVNNIARHSQCTTAEVALRIERGTLVLTLSDNGKGFDQARAIQGQGLASMKGRAKKLGGELIVISDADNGTSVILTAPVR